MSKVDEIDGLKTRQQQLEEDVDNIKESHLNLVSTNAEEVETLRRNNDELRKRLEHLERYSRDFNIRVLGVNEDEGEECMTKITDLITSLGFQDATSETENAHRTGKKRNDKPRPIIIRLYSRPFKRSLLQAEKSTDGKAILQGVRIVEDFTPSDFNGRKKALPLMKQAYKVKRYTLLQENSSLMEEKLMSLSLNSLMFLKFLRRDSEMMRSFLSLLRSLARPARCLHICWDCLSIAAQEQILRKTCF